MRAIGGGADVPILLEEVSPDLTSQVSPEFVETRVTPLVRASSRLALRVRVMTPQEACGISSRCAGHPQKKLKAPLDRGLTRAHVSRTFVMPAENVAFIDLRA
jgi:hypothetical protein